MSRHILATLILVAGAAGASTAAQDPTPVPVVQPAPGGGTREPVSTKPPAPAGPVKIELPADAAAPPAPSAPPETAESAEQQRGGGSRGRSGGQAGGQSGGGNPRGYGGNRRGYGGPGGGPYGGRQIGWGAPVYYSRPYYYDPFWMSGAFGWSPMFYAPWSLMWGTAGYWPGAWPGSTTFDTGGVRLKVKPRDAQVIVDGYYAGIVDEFDGIFQSLRLAPGGHKLEVRMPGFETLTFDVHVQPDRTMTVTETMRATP